MNETVLPAEPIVTVRSAIPGRGGDGQVRALEHHVLVHLTSETAEQVMLARELGDAGKLGGGEHHAGRVVRGVQQDGAWSAR